MRKIRYTEEQIATALRQVETGAFHPVSGFWLAFRLDQERVQEHDPVQGRGNAGESGAHRLVPVPITRLISVRSPVRVVPGPSAYREPPQRDAAGALCVVPNHSGAGQQPYHSSFGAAPRSPCSSAP